MKTRISATIDEELEKRIIKILKDSKFRNKSHLIEDAINYYIDEVLNGK
jgi:metal-responsive CopG/Arc/MetJ family transcriptional regulator